MIVGFFLTRSNFIENLRVIEIIGWTTLIFGILLYVSDKFDLQKNITSDFNYKSAILIGLFQVISLVPGVSRSGIAITVARVLKFNRVDSAKISFLISIPILGAVSIYGINNLFSKKDINFSILNLYCIFLSFIFSFITIKYFLKYIQKFNFNIFVIYRIILGLMILIFAYL